MPGSSNDGSRSSFIGSRSLDMNLNFPTLLGENEQDIREYTSGYAITIVSIRQIRTKKFTTETFNKSRIKEF